MEELDVERKVAAEWAADARTGDRDGWMGGGGDLAWELPMEGELPMLLLLLLLLLRIPGPTTHADLHECVVVMYPPTRLLPRQEELPAFLRTAEKEKINVQL